MAFWKSGCIQGKIDRPLMASPWPSPRGRTGKAAMWVIGVWEEEWRDSCPLAFPTENSLHPCLPPQEATGHRRNPGCCTVWGQPRLDLKKSNNLLSSWNSILFTYVIKINRGMHGIIGFKLFFFPIEGIVYSNGVLQRIKQFSRDIKQKRITLLWLKMAAAAAAEWCRAQALHPGCVQPSHPCDLPALSARDFKITFALLPVLAGIFWSQGNPGFKSLFFPFFF